MRPLALALTSSLLAGIAGSAATYAWLTMRVTAPETATPPSASARVSADAKDPAALDEMRARIQAMEGTLAQIARETAAGRARADGGGSGGEPTSLLSPEQKERRREVRHQQARERQRQELARLDEALKRESEDPRWSRDSVTGLQRLLQSGRIQAPFSVSALSCRSTLCGLSVKHPDAQARDAFNMQFGRQLAQARISELGVMRGESIEDERGELQTIVYFARQGHGLP
jgi:hypothetical protein